MAHLVGRKLSAALSALREAAHASASTATSTTGRTAALAAAGRTLQSAHRVAIRHMCSTVASGATVVGPAAFGGAGYRYGTALLGLGGGGAVLTLTQTATDDAGTDINTDDLPWLAQLIERPEVEEVLSPGQMLRRHPVGKMLVDQDHLFETMLTSGQVRSFRCFYDAKAKEFHSVVALGRDVCGYPQTVHGGLTAAISDETFGGLGLCMWRSGALGFRPPAYTARLEVDYKRKIPAGSLLVTSTQVEKVADRKIWMTATVSDGRGTTYATARALFIAPRMKHVLLGWIPGMGSK